MATNLCSKTRTIFASVKDIVEIYNLSKPQVYKILELPAFADCQRKMGKRCIRIDLNKFDEIAKQYFR